MPLPLFYLESAVEDFQLKRPVRVLWFLAEPRTKPVQPYQEVVQGWQHFGQPELASEAVDEMFTAQEAEMVRQELLRLDWEDARLKPVTLPVGPDLKPIGHLQEGGPIRFHHLFSDPGYSLPFAVAGCMVYGKGQVVDPRAWTEQAPTEITPSRPFGA